MSNLSDFFLHTTLGRISFVALFLVLSLLVASIFGWLPSLM